MKKLAEWCIMFSTKDVADLTIYETFCAIKCVSMRWRGMKLSCNSDIDLVEKYIASLFHHVSFVVTGCVPNNLDDDEFSIYTKCLGATNGNAGFTDQKKIISESFIAYCSGAFTFMWRSIHIHRQMKKMCDVHDNKDTKTKARIMGFNSWIDESLVNTVSKKQLRENITTAMSWAVIRPGEEELYCFLENTKVETTNPPDIFLKLRTESQHSYYCTRLKETDLYDITIEADPDTRDIACRKIVDAYFLKEYRIVWSQYFYMDESSYYNSTVRDGMSKTTAPVVLRVMGSFYVLVGSEPAGSCGTFASAFVLWMSIVGAEPYEMTVNASDTKVQVNAMFSLYDKWKDDGVAKLRELSGYNPSEDSDALREDGEGSDSMSGSDEDEIGEISDSEYTPMYIDNPKNYM